MTLIQAGFPDTRVKTLDSAHRLIIQRFRAGGPRTARVNDEANGRHYVLEVTTCTREWKRRHNDVGDSRERPAKRRLV